MIERFAALLVILILMSPCLSSAEDDAFPFRPPSVGDYVSDPSRVNFIFQNFSGPTIYPGNAGNLNFNIYNPYNRTMENITLLSEIYAYATLETYREVGENFPSPPKIGQSGALRYTTTIGDLQPGSRRSFVLTFSTSDHTPEGVYYVRFSIEFDYSNSTNNTPRHFIMKSMSFYSKEEWEYATRNATESDMPYYRHGINVTYLGVDAIIPFTSFSVKRGIPIWPIFLFVGGAGAFAILAYMYYLNDTYGKYPWLDEKTRQITGKYEKLRRSFYERARKR